jgi:phytanoyl-CoA hydroxylase
MWIDAPGALDELEARVPDRAAREHVRELIVDGFTIVRGGLPPEACDRAVRGFHNWCEANAEYVAGFRNKRGRLPRLANLQLASAPVADTFSRNKATLAVLDACLGSRASVYTSLYYETGSQQPIHRDNPLFRTEPENRFFGMWTALEDVDLTNGPLFLIPGGHRIEYVDPAPIAARHFPDLAAIPKLSAVLWDEYQACVTRHCDEHGLKLRHVPVQKGDTILWHPLLPHGGAPITDPDRTRHSIVVHTVPEQTPVYQSDVFFNRHAAPARKPWWHYRAHRGRLMAEMPPAGFPEEHRPKPGYG